MEILACFQNSYAGVLEMLLEQINGFILAKLVPFLFTFSLKGTKTHYEAIMPLKCRKTEAYLKKNNKLRLYCKGKENFGTIKTSELLSAWSIL